ncbi:MULTISPECIES: S8 family serine peptidase [Exiguobacterium]|uniref:S8 family serine peptidase n=1 Tax=Exiguobacterium TaxID=33986 RepID=UPI001BE8E960|nr:MULTISPECIES: S8 family serine peptidase [Exiguobacterium]MCT4782662.1 S8 family serine peptidase [Exiguobacterium himgiriensis]
MPQPKFYVNVSLATCLALTPGLLGLGAEPVLAKPSVTEHLAVSDKQEKQRVVVELVGAPAIEQAKQKGKKFNALSKTEQDRAHGLVKAEQKKAKDAISKKGVKAEPLEEFTTVFNGFSTLLTTSDIQKVEALPEVAAVHLVNEYERPEVKPDMVTSNGMVQSQQTWGDYGYTGEGTVVAVIDTGIDADHRDFKLSDQSKAELSESEVTSAVSEFGMAGAYINDKVPYAYNYYDENDDIRDDSPGASMHGMHVSGTVAANGDEETGGLKGVAPEAQVLGLKVFSNDPNYASTYGDIYIKAIDDAIKLGADVINMSLGSTAGFVSADSAEQQAVQRAVDNGVFVSISAGNSAYFGNGFDLPYANNPDTGVVGSPSVSSASTSVASLENDQIQLDAFSVRSGDRTDKVGWKKQDGPAFKHGEYDIVYVGDGQPDQYTGKDVKGKIVLAVRDGSYFYSNIQQTAEANGAAGVIVRGTVGHGDYVSMALSNPKIPMASLSIKDGNELRDRLVAGEQFRIGFNGDRISVANRAAGALSNFTSWGVTPNLDFKPEIAAPGGQIFSTLNDDKYGLMSGTSMAAPHVAGGAALVLQRVDEQFTLDGVDRVTMAKNLLINTSKAVTDIGPYNQQLKLNVPYTPRRGGAGLMQLHAAVSTPAVAYEKTSKEAKVALKELNRSKATFTLVVKNLSNEAVSYDVSSSLQTDLAIERTAGLVQNAMEAQPLQNATVTVNGKAVNSVKLKPNQKTEIKVAVDVSNAQVLNPKTLSGLVSAKDVFENGYFVDGFIRLSDSNGPEGNPDLVVPFVGFEGDWGKAPIFDASVYESGSFYESAGMVDQAGNYLGAKLDKSLNFDAIAFSPDGDGVKDAATPVFSLLRNAKDVKYRIVDESGNVVRTLRHDAELRKNYFDGGRNTPYYYSASYKWDGQLNGKPAPAGKYFYEIEASIDYMKKQAQTLRFPVKVDYTDPTFTAKWQGDSLTVQAKDDFAGVRSVEYLVNGKAVATSADTTATHTFASLAESDSISVRVTDHAGNATTKAVAYSNDADKPGVFLTAPLALAPYATSVIPIAGSIQDASAIQSFQVDGTDVPLTWNETTKRYDFNTTRTFADGVHKLRFVAEDAAGNVANFQRTIFVDATPATISFGKLPKAINKNQQSVRLDVTVKDNFDEVKLLVNGDLKFSQTLKAPYEMRPFSRTETITLPVVSGKNTFTFEAVDLAGNVTKETITLTKK